MSAYKVVSDGIEVGAESRLLEAEQAANRYHHENPDALSVTVDRHGHTVYNATPGEHECQAGCGNYLGREYLNRTCEACS